MHALPFPRHHLCTHGLLIKQCDKTTDQTAHSHNMLYCSLAHHHSNLLSQNRLCAISSLYSISTLHFYFYQIFFYAPVIPTRSASHIYSFSLPHKIQINFNHLIHLFYKRLKLRVQIVEWATGTRLRNMTLSGRNVFLHDKLHFSLCVLCVYCVCVVCSSFARAHAVVVAVVVVVFVVFVFVVGYYLSRLYKKWCLPLARVR